MIIISRGYTLIFWEQGKSEEFDSCDRPSNLTQIGLKSSIFQWCDLEIWLMTSKNYTTPLLHCIKLCQGVQPWALTEFPDFSLTFPWPFCGFPWPWDISSAFHYCLNTNFASNLSNHSPKVAIIGLEYQVFLNLHVIYRSNMICKWTLHIFGNLIAHWLLASQSASPLMPG